MACPPTTMCVKCRRAGEDAGRTADLWTARMHAKQPTGDTGVPPRSAVRHPRSAGHIADLTPVLNCDDTDTADCFFNDLDWW